MTETKPVHQRGLPSALGLLLLGLMGLAMIALGAVVFLRF